MQTLISCWDFFQKQFLSLRWLNALIGKLLVLSGMNPDGKLFPVLQFFLYDSIKIFFLLSVLIFIISYIQSYLPPQRTRRILGGIKGFPGRAMGALLGVLTPFCSCSSIPLFIGFSSAGLPIGVTLSFLIMSPMADLGSLTMLMTEFGWKIAAAYLVTGFMISVTGGTMIEKLGMEHYVADYIHNARLTELEEDQLTFRDRLDTAARGVADIVKRVWMYIFLGVGIGSFIHNVIPGDIVQTVLGGEHWYSVLLACVVGIPMYADIFGAIPIAEALGRHLAEDVLECYSAGTETKPQINQDAVRLLKQTHGIDMEAEGQYSKLLADIPAVDVVITMGCNVQCPFLPCQMREDWGLDDPSGKEDAAFLNTIAQIEKKILALKETLKTR